MWARIYSKLYKNVSAKEIWKTWADITNWPKWHDDLDYCKFDNNFKIGNQFILKPKGIPAVKITLTDIQEGKEFTDCTNFFGAKMYNTHIVEEKGNDTLITNKLVVTGPLRWIWIKLVAKNVADTLPDEINALVKLAKSRRPQS
ncbi:MAG: hypothetical protein WCD44_03175 [Candidatus Babeliales bacterium]